MKNFLISSFSSLGYSTKYEVKCECLADACIIARSLCSSSCVSHVVLSDLDSGFVQRYVNS